MSCKYIVQTSLADEWCLYFCGHRNVAKTLQGGEIGSQLRLISEISHLRQQAIGLLNKSRLLMTQTRAPSVILHSTRDIQIMLFCWFAI